jgi:hypothetical protein
VLCVVVLLCLLLALTNEAAKKRNCELTIRAACNFQKLKINTNKSQTQMEEIVHRVTTLASSHIFKVPVLPPSPLTVFPGVFQFSVHVNTRTQFLSIHKTGGEIVAKPVCIIPLSWFKEPFECVCIAPNRVCINFMGATRPFQLFAAESESLEQALEITRSIARALTSA